MASFGVCMYMCMCRHFHNLASWFGREYHGESVGNPVDAGMLLQLLKEIINRMDINRY
jgi:hypothetical protein